MRIQQFQYFRDLELIQPQRAKFVVPAFALDAQAWYGTSRMISEFDIGNAFIFSLKLPIRQFGSAFMLAIRWTEDSISYRFKLWSDSKAVLYYPVYNGERIGANAVLEIWSINSTSAPTLSAEKSLETSFLAFSTSSCCSCCDNPDVQQLLVLSEPSPLPPYAYCNPFCDILL